MSFTGVNAICTYAYDFYLRFLTFVYDFYYDKITFLGKNEKLEFFDFHKNVMETFNTELFFSSYV